MRAAAAALCVLLAAGGAHAADWCFNSSSPPNPAPPTDPDILVVASSWKLPKRGKCRAVSGFDIGFYNQEFARPASGTACLDSAATKLLVALDLPISWRAGSTASAIHVYMEVPYPALSGGQVIVRIETPFTSLGRTDAIVGPCGFKIPIP